MSYFFKADEIFQTGVQIEQNGIKFYQRLADLTKDAKIKQIYESLRDAEKNHVEVFRKLLKEVASQKGALQSVKDFPEEDTTYLKTMADNNVFTGKINLDEISRKIKSTKDAVNLALDFEKSSVLFYTQMKKFTRPELGEQQINKLIKQEEEHIRILNDLLKKHE
ncbi:MAG: ferritin family protein [Planctomycetota bacterium]